MKKYPAGTVRHLLETDLVTAPTRNALEMRMSEMQSYQPAFFDDAAFNLLRAVCMRLMPQNSVDCAAFIDGDLHENKSDGWRYDKLPGDEEIFRKGLEGINQTSQLNFSADFEELSEIRRDKILTEIQNGKAQGDIWKKLPAELFFEELLAKTVEVYYAHPLAQEKIGYVGMADAPGWQRIKLNELEPREPRIVKD